MSTYSPNLFAVLSEGGEVRPEPVAAPKEEKKVEQPKAENKRTPKGGAARGGDRPKREGRAPRRQFDRQSGTGIIDTEKKVKQAWGHPETAEAEASKDTLNPADPDAPEKEVAAPVEEEEQVKTLDEYLAEKANKSLKVSLPEARKANDADDSAFKGAVTFTKETFEEFYTSKETKAPKKATDKVKKEKVLVDIEQRFEEKSAPRENVRGGRGGRGGARGGRGARGGARGARGGNNARKESKAPAVNIADVAAFPSLGA
ncbi:hypothetical protein INT47_003693 [Mucor saturninus]|uniref:Hyaluronan/mRNA-binding protein domain-containing protein n=1 Tax=Mucor saturninus TaxID=64648 RepID=A0A8H7V1L2_9FUNG|nr:hypothetical protein INT47_003693 [Mucor saturninus]